MDGFELLQEAIKVYLHPTTKIFLDRIANTEHNVEMLTYFSQRSQGNVSNHLKRMKEVGMVNSRRQKKYVYYKINWKGVEAVKNALAAYESSLPDL